jgi:opacity protein-like surface antigen
VARAADLSMPAPMIVQPEMSGWYLRGDIGFTNQRVGSLFNANYANFTAVTNIDKTFDAAPLFGLGFGYNFSSWLRADITGEYRGSANFKGLDVGTLPGPCASGPGPCFADDRYTASKSEWLFLANGYVDLGTWSGFTPFLGAGVGMSRNTIKGFGDFTTCLDSSACATTGGSDAFAGSASKWNFAWALHAGLAYKITPTATLEFAYRYVNLGKAQSGDVIAFDGTNTIVNPMEFRNITSSDFKFGLRWNCCDIPPAPLRVRG